MSDNASLFERGYSPYLAGELEIGGERLQLSSLGPGKLTVRDAKLLPPGRGLLRVTVDCETDVRLVELHEGIDPARREQPFRVVQMVSAVA